MTDNTTAHMASEYDDKIDATVPFYREFHQAAVDLALAVNPSPRAWLDTGCGTGTLCLLARRQTPDTAFTLADPSPQMIEKAKNKLKDIPTITFADVVTQNLTYEENTFDVVTAVQSHHYLDRDARKAATENCFRMLKPNGVFITFENILPSSEYAVRIALKRWGDFQVSRGKSRQEADEHLMRFNKEFFPITIFEHINLLRDSGFITAEILWASYMQAGFYAIKD